MVVTVAVGRYGHPVIAPMIWDKARRVNVVLSFYEKTLDDLDVEAWIARHIRYAVSAGEPYFRKDGSVDTEPKPEATEAASWSPDPISVDRPTEPRRKILSLPPRVKDPTPDRSD